MKAYIDHYFKNGFFLNEENLIKLTDIINKRLKEKDILPTELKYKIIRSDSMLFETKDYNEIIREENSKRNLIRRLELSIENDTISLELAFDKSENTFLSIESIEKDFAYLLFSDIKEYLQTEVLRYRGFEFKKIKFDRYILPLFMIFFMVFTFTSLRNNVPKENIEKIIKSESVSTKLNFLIEKSQMNIDTKSLWYLAIGTIIITVFSLTCFEFLDFAYPRNIFYYGKEIKRYDKHCNIRGKVIWGILIALIVSLFAGFIVYYLTKQ